MTQRVTAGFLDQSQEHNLYRNLCISVILQGIVDALGERGGSVRNKNSKGVNVQEEAFRWIKSRSKRVASFVWYCDAVDLSPDYVRAKMKAFAASGKSIAQVRAAVRSSPGMA